eukprot:GHVL01010699.1.p1 GENE.GHVL01010699.1~~GHVL01010699.1.p1  ORF type:complete len:244 (-),score=46.71 GHVL01010699.1:791-1522(-)
MGGSNCKADPWPEWDDCPLQCWDGYTTAKQTRKRATVCEGEEDVRTEDSRECPENITKITCPVDCKATAEWTPWSDCSEVCGEGTHFRTREMEEALNGGVECEDKDKHEEATCNAGVCPIDCKIALPGEWTDCDKTCGPGTRSRTRELEVEPNETGKTCVEVDKSGWECTWEEQVEDICIKFSDDCPDNPPCEAAVLDTATNATDVISQEAVISGAHQTYGSCNIVLLVAFVLVLKFLKIHIH